MIESRIASRYAKSLIELAIEKNKVENVHADMETFLIVLKENPSLHLMLQSPIIHTDRKEKVLKEIFGKRMDGITMELFHLLTRKGREYLMKFVAEEFILRYNDYKGIVKAELVSSQKLDKENLERIKNAIEKIYDKQISIEEKLNPSLIGGFVLKVGDKYWDGSIISQIKKIKSEFQKNPYLLN